MRRLSRLCFVFCILLLVKVPALAEQSLLVITNVKNIEKLDKKQIKQIFLSGGRMGLVPINYPAGDSLRRVFNSNIMGLTEARLQSYWAQMKFTGRAKPPREVPNPQALFSQIDSDIRFIAYIPAVDEIPEGITVIYSINF